MFDACVVELLLTHQVWCIRYEVSNVVANGVIFHDLMDACETAEFIL